jgi:hypothetical protein
LDDEVAELALGWGVVAPPAEAGETVFPPGGPAHDSGATPTARMSAMNLRFDLSPEAIRIEISCS